MRTRKKDMRAKMRRHAASMAHDAVCREYQQAELRIAYTGWGYSPDEQMMLLHELGRIRDRLYESQFEKQEPEPPRCPCCGRAGVNCQKDAQR